MAIYPTQVEPINTAFSPTADEVAFAARVVEAFQHAEAEGSAAIQLDGQLIDYPIVESASASWQLPGHWAIRCRQDVTHSDVHQTLVRYPGSA